MAKIIFSQIHFLSGLSPANFRAVGCLERKRLEVERNRFTADAGKKHSNLTKPYFGELQQEKSDWPKNSKKIVRGQFSKILSCSFKKVVQ